MIALCRRVCQTAIHVTAPTSVKASVTRLADLQLVSCSLHTRIWLGPGASWHDAACDGVRCLQLLTSWSLGMHT